MKKTTLFAVMLAMTASCTVSEIDSIKGTTAPVITASYENNGTKTAITTDDEGVGTIWWKPADEINVFYGTTSIHYVSKNTENATTVAFGTTDIIGSTESAQENIWGLYPYDENAVCDGESVTTTIPSSQKGVAGTFDDDIFTSLAHSTSTVMTFYNVLGGIKFSLSRVDIQSITFKGNNNEDIAGTVKLEMDANGKPVTEITEGVKTITLTPKEGTTFASNTNYYIVLLPTVLEEGFTMTFETETEIGTFEYTEKSIEIKRSVFSKKENIDSYAEFVGEKIIPDGAIDLGLSVCWATCNVGATSQEKYGDYYAWGETETYYEDGEAESSSPIMKSGKEEGYRWTSYKWCNGTNESLTKYCTRTDYSADGNPDYIISLTQDDDIAYVELGDGWRIPSNAQWRELLDDTNCSWEWSNIGGINGYKVTSKIPGYTDKWIFLPAAGYRGGLTYQSANSYGFYWSSSTGPISNGNAVSFSFYKSKHEISCYENRYFGYTVRPIYFGHHLQKISGKSATNESSGYNDYYKCTDSSCEYYWEDKEGSFLIGNNTDLETWKSPGGRGYIPPLNLMEGAVDMGLSVYWASCNIGANTPEEYGDYWCRTDGMSNPKVRFPDRLVYKKSIAHAVLFL